MDFETAFFLWPILPPAPLVVVVVVVTVAASIAVCVIREKSKTIRFWRECGGESELPFCLNLEATIEGRLRINARSKCQVLKIALL